MCKSKAEPLYPHNGFCDCISLVIKHGCIMCTKQPPHYVEYKTSFIVRIYDVIKQTEIQSIKLRDKKLQRKLHLFFHRVCLLVHQQTVFPLCLSVSHQQTYLSSTRFLNTKNLSKR